MQPDFFIVNRGLIDAQTIFTYIYISYEQEVWRSIF